MFWQLAKLWWDWFPRASCEFPQFVTHFHRQSVQLAAGDKAVSLSSPIPFPLVTGSAVGQNGNWSCMAKQEKVTFISEPCQSQRKAQEIAAAAGLLCIIWSHRFALYKYRTNSRKDLRKRKKMTLWFERRALFYFINASFG